MIIVVSTLQGPAGLSIDDKENLIKANFAKLNQNFTPWLCYVL